MRKDHQQMDKVSALSKIGSYITSIFKGAQVTEINQVELAVDQESSVLSVITEDVRPVNVVRTRDWCEKMHESIDEATDKVWRGFDLVGAVSVDLEALHHLESLLVHASDEQKLAHLCQGVEAAALRSAIDGEAGSVQLLMHDGFVTSKPIDMGAAEHRILLKTGYQLQLVEKKISVFDYMAELKTAVSAKSIVLQ